MDRTLGAQPLYTVARLERPQRQDGHTGLTPIRGTPITPQQGSSWIREAQAARAEAPHSGEGFLERIASKEGTFGQKCAWVLLQTIKGAAAAAAMGAVGGALAGAFAAGVGAAPGALGGAVVGATVGGTVSFMWAIGEAWIPRGYS